jgi:hypothetical protein
LRSRCGLAAASEQYRFWLCDDAARSQFPKGETLNRGNVLVPHQRKLADQPRATRLVVYLNLLILEAIILLPVTVGLYGAGNAREEKFISFNC